VILKCSAAVPGEEETAENTSILIQHVNDKGKVEFYTRNLCPRHDLVTTISELMWAATVLPLYRSAL